MLGLNNVTGTCLQILSVAIHHSITSLKIERLKFTILAEVNLIKRRLFFIFFVS